MSRLFAGGAIRDLVFSILSRIKKSDLLLPLADYLLSNRANQSDVFELLLALKNDLSAEASEELNRYMSFFSELQKVAITLEDIWTQKFNIVQNVLGMVVAKSTGITQQERRELYLMHVSPLLSELSASVTTTLIGDDGFTSYFKPKIVAFVEDLGSSLDNETLSVLAGRARQVTVID